MPALENTVLAADLVRTFDIDFVMRFNETLENLREVLGIPEISTLAAGTALYQYKVTGQLNRTKVAEGDIVPLSHFTQEKKHVVDLELKPYRKLTTAQAIQAHGLDAALTQTDAKMLSLIQNDVLEDFYAFIGNGTGAGVGDTWQAAFANADAVLATALDAANEASSAPIFFANRMDLGTYLGTAQVLNMGSAFGFTYISGFMGIGTTFFSSRVPQGTVICTPAENLRLYKADLGELNAAGFNLYTDETGLIGVHHQPIYERNSVETFMETGLTLFAENTDYIVKATVAGSKPSGGTSGGEVDDDI